MVSEELCRKSYENKKVVRNDKEWSICEDSDKEMNTKELYDEDGNDE